MQDHQGLFIVLEGADGSGKTTQLRLLAERLKAVGHEVAIFDFPRYEEQSSYFVKRYLNGDYGEATAVSPYTASLFYALDRYEAAPQIKEALGFGKIVLSNRYVGSNMAHQGSKFGSESQQRGFFVWAESLEFQLLGVPRPSLNIYLKVPPRISYELISRKVSRSYTDKKRDGHESNLEYLERSSATYDLLTKLFPKDFREIDCSHNGQILDIARISNAIWTIIKPLLPPNPPNRAKPVVLNIRHIVSGVSGTGSTTNHKKINSSTSSLRSSDVKFKTNELSLLAAGLLIGMKEFSATWEVSWIKAKTKDDCRFFVPSELPSELKKSYIKTMDHIAELYVKMKQVANTATLSKKSKVQRRDLVTAVSAVIPLSAHSSVLLNSDSESTQLAIDKLLYSSPKLLEIESLTKNLKDVTGGSKQQTKNRNRAIDELTRPQAIEQVIKDLAQSRLSLSLPVNSDSVKLVDYRPRNELELLTDGIYTHSGLSKNHITADLDSWSYRQKTQALSQALLQKPTNLLSNVHYRWDITSDRLKLHYMLKNNLINDLKQQSISPRYGYAVPEAIEFLGLEDQFLKCFDLSLEFYDRLQDSGFEFLSGYVTLLGHRVRWQFTTPASSWRTFTINVHGSPIPHASFFKLINEKIAEVHPQLAKVLFSKKPPSVVKKGYQTKKTIKPSPTKKTKNKL